MRAFFVGGLVTPARPSEPLLTRHLCPLCVPNLGYAPRHGGRLAQDEVARRVRVALSAMPMRRESSCAMPLRAVLAGPSPERGDGQAGVAEAGDQGPQRGVVLARRERQGRGVRAGAGVEGAAI